MDTHLLSIFFSGCLAFLPAILLGQQLEIAHEADATLSLSAHPQHINTGQRIEMAGDQFTHWFPLAAHRDGGSWEWATEMEDTTSRFFRLIEAPLPQVPDHVSWKREISLFSDGFRSNPTPGGSGEEVRWIKFAIRLDDLPEVFFQNTTAFPFHYDFASQHLGYPFAGMSRASFNQHSLYHNDRTVVLGTVLMAPKANEYAIQFVGQDVFPKEMLRFLYDLVDAKITSPATAQGFYLPTTEQATHAQDHIAYFGKHGINIASAYRWSSGDGCYATGWTLGRLVYIATADIDQAYLDGKLLPTDILLTDAVPAEIPSVAGIVSLQPATPNSHVAILARSYGIPFGYISEPTQQVEIQALDGRRIFLQVDHGGWGGACRVRTVDIHDVNPTFLASVIALKEPTELSLQPIENLGEISMNSLDTVTPEDIRYIGGKAANFGFLRRGIPDNSPDARAITFDLWNSYLDQPLPAYGNRSLGQEISLRLEGITWPPADMATVDTTLSGIRELIKKEADFSPSQRTAILAALSGLDPKQKIRFRSSTNVEDSASFVGAGLYDSFSGCIMDDTDADELGPSHCDPNQPKERGVFRALRKVYASFYNLNAYLERLRRDVDESQVGMAILVHYSFPDEVEAANGVATTSFRATRNPLQYYFGEYVNQLGAESITNPSGGSLPEIVDLGYAEFNPNGPPAIDLGIRQRSSLLPENQDTVMVWKDDYETLTGLLFDVCSEFNNTQELSGNLTLEFETKKLTNDQLIVKQIRQIPDLTDKLPPEHVALLNEPLSWRVFQGEASDVFANHRLKSLWHISTDNRWLDEAGLTSSPLDSCQIEFISECGHLGSLEGSPGDWPSSTWTSNSAKQSWQTRIIGTPATLSLDLNFRATPSRSQPVITARDRPVYYEAEYETPQLSVDYRGQIIEITSESVHLELGTPAGTSRGTDRLITRTGAAEHVSIETSYYWPPDPNLSAGYTAPLERWDKTTISGLTNSPVVLRGYYSQTYRPEHHNFGASFIFEPGLETDLPTAQRDALEASNIKQIYMAIGLGPEPRMWLIGFDGTIRKLSP